MKEAIKKKIAKKQNKDVNYNTPPNKDKTFSQQQFREHISDMSNYAEKFVENTKKDDYKIKLPIIIELYKNN